MHQRFSIGRVLEDVVRMITDHWLALLVVLAAFGAVFWGVDALLERLDLLDAALDGPVAGLAVMAERLLRTALYALMVGAILHVVLTGGDLRDPEERRAPFRTAIIRFPTIFVVLLLIVLPSLLNIVLGGLALANLDYGRLSDAEVGRRIAGLNLAGWVANLVVCVFIGFAPAAAVAEGLGTRAALARSIRLIRDRSPLIFCLFVAALTAALLAAGVVVRLLLSVGPQALIHGQAVITMLAVALTILFLAALYLELRRLNAPPPEAEPAVGA
jgi:hypothetical protein